MRTINSFDEFMRNKHPHFTEMLRQFAARHWEERERIAFDEIVTVLCGPFGRVMP